MKQHSEWLQDVIDGGLVICVALITFAVAAAIGPRPQPLFHDEFSYLLAADTFARGRLANPIPPAWEHFESFQVLLQPSYASKYPPGQGMALALGLMLTGDALIGVWLAGAAASLGAWWLVRAIGSRKSALASGLLVATHPLIMEWSRCYWGGTIAMAGGCLLLGGALRWIHRPSIGAGLTTGLGLAVLANSRPFEGAMVSMAIGVVLVFRLASMGRWREQLPAAATMLAVLGACATWLGAYNHAVTGNAINFPYVEYERQYAVTPALMFLPAPREPVFRVPVMREYYTDWERPQYLRHRSWSTLPAVLAEKLWKYAQALFRSPLLALVMLAGLWTGRRSWAGRMVIAACVAGILAGISGLWAHSHYLAPAMGALVILAIFGVRAMGAWSNVAAGVVIATQVAATAWWLVQLSRHGDDGFQYRRAELIEELKSLGGRHLVLVRNDPGAWIHMDWVYNGADPASEVVLFGRDLGAERNGALLRAYPGRELWGVTIGRDGAQVRRLGRAP